MNTLIYKKWDGHNKIMIHGWKDENQNKWEVIYNYLTKIEIRRKV